MNEDLTREERTMLAQIEASGKWDHLVHDLSIMTPSYIIMGIGLYFASPPVVIIGMIVYAMFALRMSLRQGKAMLILKSLIEKLKAGRENLP